MAIYSNGISTKETILQTARELFFTQGYEATTTRQISRQSQANLGLIKYHFNTKANIGLAIYQEILETLADWADGASGNATEKLLLAHAAEIKLAFSSHEFARFYAELFEEPQVMDLYMEELGKVIPRTYVPKRRVIGADHTLFLQICLSATKVNIIHYLAPRPDQIDNLSFFLMDCIQLYIELFNLENMDELQQRCLSCLNQYHFSLNPDMTLEITENPE